VISPKVCVRRISGRGRGVVANMAIRKGSTIERSPYLELSAEDTETIEGTSLAFYHYDVRGHEGCAIGLGYTSLYNHAEDPNAEFELFPNRGVIVIKAIKEIKVGQEVTIYYGWNHEHFKRAGFRPR
jgi:SET domain-containing protein